jgi:hypothetical protein
MKIWLALAAIAALSASAGPALAIDKAACVSAAQEGQELRDAKKLGEAREKLLLCAQNACPEVIRNDCTGWLGDVESRRSSLVFSAKDGAGNDLSDVRVSAGEKLIVEKLDGSAVFLDPGEYTLVFEAGGKQTEKKVIVAEGQKARAIDIVIGEAEKKPTDPPGEAEAGVYVPPIVLVSIGAAGLVAFAALQGIAQGEYADLEDGCGATRSCTDDDVAGTRTKFVASGVMLGVGGAAVATAVILWIVDATSAPSKTAPTAFGGVSSEAAFLGLSIPLDL